METPNRPQEDSNSHALAVYVKAVLFARILRVPGARMWAIETPDGLVPLHTNRAVAYAKLGTMQEVVRVVARLACIEVAEGGNAESDAPSSLATRAQTDADARARTDVHALTEQGAAALIAIASSSGTTSAPRTYDLAGDPIEEARRWAREAFRGLAVTVTPHAEKREACGRCDSRPCCCAAVLERRSA